MVLTKYILPVFAAAGAAYAQCNGPSFEIESAGDAAQLATCRTVKGDVIIGEKVGGAVELNGVQQITGDLKCVNASQLTSISADRLGTIGGKFQLERLQILSSLNFDALQEVTTIQWRSLPQLSTLAFARGVSKVDNIQISDTALQSLAGLELEVVALMDINNNRYMRTVNVNDMTNVTQAITFAANSKELAVEFPNLVAAANMTFRNISAIKVPSLAEVDGSIGFYSNTFEELFLPNLTKTGQALVFSDGMGLKNITAPKLKSVGAALNINNNPDLKEITGFPKLEVIVGALDFSGDFDKVDLPALNDVRGGFNMQTTSSEFSCNPFDDAQNKEVIKGVYSCRSGEKDPGRLGTNQGSDGKNGNKKGAAPGFFVPSLSVYSLAGFALLFML